MFVIEAYASGGNSNRRRTGNTGTINSIVGNRGGRPAGAPSQAFANRQAAAVANLINGRGANRAGRAGR